MNTPTGIAIIPGSQDLLVAPEGHNGVRIIFSETGTIASFAGTGTAGVPAAGMFATATQLGPVPGIAVQRDGSVLVTQYALARVMVVWPNGTIDTWMGSGTAVSSGDGQFRTSAQVDRPWKLSVHPETGDVFVMERVGGRVRRVNAVTGIVSSLVGFSPTDGAPLVPLSIQSVHDVAAVAGEADVFVIADFGASSMYLINAASKTAALLAGTTTAGFNGDGLPAIRAQINGPGGVVFDPVSLSAVFADHRNYRVRTFMLGGNISTFAGNGTTVVISEGGDPLAAAVVGPSAVAVEPFSRDLLISEYSGHRVRRVSAACLPAPQPVSDKSALRALHQMQHSAVYVSCCSAGIISFVCSCLRRYLCRYLGSAQSHLSLELVR